jgi:hypothetical protein
MVDYLILAVVFLLLWGGHWAPWSIVPLLTDERGDLKRVPAYAYGCASILAGFVLWALARQGTTVSPWSAVTFLAMDMVAAGTGTVLPRLARREKERQALRGDVPDYEQALQD